MFGAVSSVLGIGVSFFLKDNFSAEAARINRSFNALSDNVQNRVRNQLTSIQQMSAGVALAGAGIIYGMRGAIIEVANFEESLYKTKGIAGLTTIEVAKLKDLSLQMSRQFPYTAQQISDSFLELSKAGVAVKDMEKMTKAVLSFATAADIAVGGEEGATNMLLNIMAQFSMGYDKAQLVADKISKAANLTTVDPAQIYETFKYAIPVMRQFKVGLDESLALVSALAQSGLKSTIAGTTFSNMYRFLGDAVGPFAKKKQVNALKMLGLSPQDFVDAHGNLKSLVPILEVIQKKIQGMGTVQKQWILETLFSVRGERGTNLLNFLDGKNLKGMPAKNIGDILAQITSGSAGSAEAIVKARMEGPAQQALLFSKAMFELKVAFKDAVFPIILPAMHALTKGLRLVTSFGKTGVGKWVMIAGSIGVVLVTIGAAIASFMASAALFKLSSRYLFMGTGPGAILNIFQMLSNNLRGVFTFFTATGRLMGGTLMRFLPLWGTALTRLFGSSGSIVTGLGAMLRVMGPWAMAIGAIIAGITLIYKYSDEIGQFFSNIGNAISNFFSTSWAYIKYGLRMVKGAIMYFDTNEDVFGNAKKQLQKDLVKIHDSKAVTSYNYYNDSSRGKENATEKHIKTLAQAINSSTQPITIQLVTPDGKQLSMATINRSMSENLVSYAGLKLS